MSMDQFPVFLIAVPLTLVPLSFFVFKLHWSVRAFAIWGLGLVTLLSWVPLTGRIVFDLELPLLAYMGNWDPELGIVLGLDMVAALLLPVMNTVILLGASIGYKPSEHVPIPFFPLWFLLAAGTNGLVVTSDLFNAYVFLEITSICSHALVAYRGDGYAFESAFKYLVAGLVGSAFLLWGIIALFASTGTLSLSVLVERLADAPGPLVAAGFALIVCGLFVKLAIVPFHIWKPDGLSGAPSAVAGTLSGVVLSAALVLLLRVLVGLGGLGTVDLVGRAIAEPLKGVLFALGLASVVVGHSLALVQSRLTRMLAYSSVGHFGVMLLALSVSTTAAVAALLFHAMNHAVMKSGMFFLAAGARAERGGDRIRALGGYLRGKPLETIACAVFMLALIGVPPTAGFASKWAIVVQLVQAGSLVAAVIVALGGVISVPYYLRAFRIMAGGTTPTAVAVQADPRQFATRAALTVGVVYLFAAFVLSGSVFALSETAVTSLLEALL
ncbi:MAG: hypothetical protein EA383_05245 [Spirochaetaceae bacterium]|nr:MAG: hypothetical protein EA383_05245 [Spirochaetaceae bacterium]